MKRIEPWSLNTIKIVKIATVLFISSRIPSIRCEQGLLSDSYLTEESSDSLTIHVGKQKPNEEDLKNNDESAECYTNKGEVGECKPFHVCFPILANKSESYSNANANSEVSEDIELPSLTSSWTELQEEIFNNTESTVCLKRNSTSDRDKLMICCAILQPYETTLHDVPKTKDDTNEVKPKPPPGTANVLPTSCGQVFEYPRRKYQNLDKTQKITGGRDANPGQFPWMVAIFGKNGKHTCGASLINNEFILTASHCLFTYTANDVSQLRVHMGDFNIKSISDGPHETRKISKIILHKGFNSKTYFNDIALMKLDSPVNFTNKIQPICLPTLEKEDLEGYNAIVMGWGRNRQWGQASAVLKAVEIPIWQYSACHRVFSTFAPGRLMESNICAGDGKRNKDACIGDSGGPLVIRDLHDHRRGTEHTSSVLRDGPRSARWTHIGIVSWGKGCGSFPGVYTATKSFIPWIIKNLEH